MIAYAGADIELKNSMLALDFERRLISSSMASTVESGLRTLRRTHTRLNSSGGRSSSSFRVPERSVLWMTNLPDEFLSVFCKGLGEDQQTLGIHLFDLNVVHGVVVGCLFLFEVKI